MSILVALYFRGAPFGEGDGDCLLAQFGGQGFAGRERDSGPRGKPAVRDKVEGVPLPVRMT
jgi:hypothetical protein